jgi:hypothetical protein
MTSEVIERTDPKRRLATCFVDFVEESFEFAAAIPIDFDPDCRGRRLLFQPLAGLLNGKTGGDSKAQGIGCGSSPPEGRIAACSKENRRRAAVGKWSLGQQRVHWQYLVMRTTEQFQDNAQIGDKSDSFGSKRIKFSPRTCSALL